MESSFWRDAKTSTRGACAPRSRLGVHFSVREMLRRARPRISHATALINAVGRALSKRLEREKARMN